jgi:hypothetical protein
VGLWSKPAGREPWVPTLHPANPPVGITSSDPDRRRDGDAAASASASGSVVPPAAWTAKRIHRVDVEMRRT